MSDDPCDEWHETKIVMQWELLRARKRYASVSRLLGTTLKAAWVRAFFDTHRGVKKDSVIVAAVKYFGTGFSERTVWNLLRRPRGEHISLQSKVSKAE